MVLSKVTGNWYTNKDGSPIEAFYAAFFGEEYQDHPALIHQALQQKEKFLIANIRGQKKSLIPIKKDIIYI
jgi:hypothetical protein